MIEITSLGALRYRAYTGRTVNGSANNEEFTVESADSPESSGLPNTKIPDKWITKDGMAWGAINKAVEFMKNELGIDADGRTPTHEITDEQREWLSSRHDMSNMQCNVIKENTVNGQTSYYSTHTAEYGNFLADLVYLNVYSPDEAKMLNMVSVRGTPDVYSGGGFTPAVCSVSGALSNSIARQTNLIAYLENKKKGFVPLSESDEELLEKARELFAQKQNCVEVLLNIIDDTDIKEQT